MKVKEVIEYLSRMNPEADVVIERDVQTHGFGFLGKIEVGIFVETDYGNDFFLEQRLVVNPREVRAVCLVAEEDVAEIARDPRKELDV